MILQKQLIKEHNNICFYCEHKIGSPYWYKDKIRLSRKAFDHFLPFTYVQENPDKNWVLSCNLCNAIKSKKIFHSRKEARDYVKHRRKKKGYEYYEDLSSMPV